MNIQQGLLKLIDSVDNQIIYANEYSKEDWHKDKTLIYKFLEQDLDISWEEFYRIITIVRHFILVGRYDG